MHVELDHHVRDHRLRAHFPLPAEVTGSDAECAFAVVHRGPDRGGWAARVRPAHVRVTTVRRLLHRRRRHRARAGPRRTARVRGRRRRHRTRAHTATRHGIPLTVDAVAATQPGRPPRSAPRPASAGTGRARLRGGAPPRRRQPRRARGGGRRRARPAGAGTRRRVARSVGAGDGPGARGRRRRGVDAHPRRLRRAPAPRGEPHSRRPRGARCSATAPR